MAKDQHECKFKAVMLIDDNDIDNMINQKMIEGNNFAELVFMNSSALSGLEFLKNICRVRDFSDVYLPRIIFLDINMPIMDGFQFLDEFATLPNEITETAKIVMLSSSMNPRDVERSKGNKFVHDYITKPLNSNNLQAIEL